jgi:hypothetical protein
MLLVLSRMETRMDMDNIKDTAVDLKNKVAGMGDVEQKIRLAIGSAAAASAIFAPLSYKWKGILTAIAADAILTGVYGVSPLRHLMRG